jgi:hypothetical protein
MENDRKIMSSYLDHAQASADDLAGGFAAASPQRTIIGSAPIAYPRQPQNSPWASDPLPPEPPLGIDINAMEPTGEVHEQKASEAIAGDAAAPGAQSADGGLRRKGWRRL